MKVLFYGRNCQFSNTIMEKIKNTDLINEFKLVCMDDNKDNFSKIKVVPTIIDSNCNEVMEGKKALEYINSQRFFDYPTNNILSWKDKDVPKPEIVEDKLANNNLNLVSDQDFENKKESLTIETNNEIKEEIIKEPENSKFKELMKNGKINRNASLLLRRR